MLMNRSLTFLFLWCTGVSAAWSTIREVNAPASINAVVSESFPGDTIILNNGTFHESVQIEEHGLVLGSRFVLDNDSSHIGNTIIRAGGDSDSSSCIIISLAEDDSVRIIGLSLRSGTGTRWATEPQPIQAGGGIFSLRSRVSVERCQIDSCSAEAGGGIAVVRETLGGLESYLHVSNTCIKNCFSTYPGGGGIYARSAGVSACSTLIAECTSIASGGIQMIDAPLSMTACTIRSCRGETGGVWVSGHESHLDGNVFEQNGVVHTTGTCHLYGGGRVYVRRNIFRNNSSDHPAIDLADFSRFGVPFFEGNVLESHTMTNYAGAIYLWDCEGDFSYNVIRNNHAPGGASIFPGGRGLLRIHHNVFSSNSQGPTGYGSVISYTNSGNRPAIVDSNLFEGNTGPAISYHPDYPPPQTIDARNNWWGHESGPYNPALNQDGTGDTLYSALIDFIPWLTLPPDTSYTGIPERDGVGVIPSTWELLPVYPNPFNSALQISIAGFARDDFDISLYDILGRKVTSVHSGSLSGGTISYVPGGDLSTGVYLLRASDSHSRTSIKVLYLK